MREISVAAPERGRDLAVTVWYPAEAGGEPVLVGDNKVFKGAPASINAPLAERALSAGRDVAWIGRPRSRHELACDGTGQGQASSLPVPITPAPPAATRRRPTRRNCGSARRILSAVIDTLTADPTWSGVVDAGRIGVVGFSLGGAAAMEIAGARPISMPMPATATPTRNGIAPGMQAVPPMSTTKRCRSTRSICARSTRHASNNQTSIAASNRPFWSIRVSRRPMTRRA